MADRSTVEELAVGRSCDSATNHGPGTTRDRGCRHVPALSVVLPVWRPDPRYFRQAVESLLEQTLEDFELLIEEDPSEASAAAALSGLNDPRIVLSTHGERTSMVEQLNRGLERARAPLVARMDGDDIADPRRFELQVAELRARPEIDVLGTQISVIDEAGRPLGERRFPLEHAEIVARLRRENPISHPSVIMRKRTVLEAGGYRYPERPAQDYELWSRLANRGARLANLPQMLLEYRLHSSSVKSRQVAGTLRATIEVKREHWWDTMTFGDRLRYGAEQAALLLPSSWVYALASYRRYGSTARREP